MDTDAVEVVFKVLLTVAMFLFLLALGIGAYMFSVGHWK